MQTIPVPKKSWREALLLKLRPDPVSPSFGHSCASFKVSRAISRDFGVFYALEHSHQPLSVSIPRMQHLDIEHGSASSLSDSEGQYQALTREELQRQLEALRDDTNVGNCIPHQKEQFAYTKQFADVSPTADERLGFWTVISLIMNRTIAAGIFAQPVTILRHAGSPGMAVILWILAGLIVYATMVCWLEFGMSVPFVDVFHNGQWVRRAAPRSGGDKNYLEYVYKKPRMLATCIFGITFLIFSNLAGNAIQFGIYVETARNPELANSPDCKDGSCLSRASILGWAIGVLSACAFINISTRRYSIVLNNFFALIKIIFLLFIIFAGIIWGSTHSDTAKCTSINLSPRGSGGGFGDIVASLIYAMYPYGGFEQPFYVLAEVEQPRKIFPKATNVAMITLLILYPLVNVSFLCMVPFTSDASLPSNMTLAFFNLIDRPIATHFVPLILAIFIFGNIMAQTFTASRVKQEVAKEGILPWSLVFAKNSDTLISRFKPRGPSGIAGLDNHREQAPIAATFLHLAIAIILVLIAGIPLSPTDAFQLLSFVKSFTIIGVLGFFTVAGLLYLKINARVSKGGGRKWKDKKQWSPWLDPLPTAVATGGLAFVLVAVFAPPNVDELGGRKLKYWVAPLTGWLAPFLGLMWWCGLRFVQWRGRWRLEVSRKPYIEADRDGEFVQRAEIVEHEKVFHRRRGD